MANKLAKYRPIIKRLFNEGYTLSDTVIILNAATDISTDPSGLSDYCKIYGLKPSAAYKSTAKAKPRERAAELRAEIRDANRVVKTICEPKTKRVIKAYAPDPDSISVRIECYCKDCIHLQKGNECPKCWNIVNDYDFCSNAKRKVNE